MALPLMIGDYYDPDTNPRVPGAYDPCALGILLMFDPEPGVAATRANITSIGSVNEIEFVLKVTRVNGPNELGILTKQQVPNPAIELFSYRVHNRSTILEGSVSVRAEISNGVKNVYIEP